MENVVHGNEKVTGRILEINEKEIRGHLESLVKESVEDTLNKLLAAEAENLCGAKRYEHSESRADTLAGSYTRKLQTRVGEVELKVPRLRNLPFETQIIERYRRREASVEESLIEMYLAGVSVRRVEDITEALWGTKVSASTVSSLNKQIYGKIDEWRNRPLEGNYSYVYLDGIYLKRSWGGEVKNVAVLVAVGVDNEGYRTVLGVAEGCREDKESWGNFLRYLKSRGLKGVKLFISDKSLGLVESLPDFYPDAKWQRCVVHWYRNVFSVTPKGRVREVASMLKAIHAQEDKAAAISKAQQVVAKLKEKRLDKAARLVEESVLETLSYMDFPDHHWTKLRTNNPLERIMREIRRRTRVVGAFPDGESAMMLIGARLRYIAGSRWGTKKYMDMNKLKEEEKESAA